MVSTAVKRSVKVAKVPDPKKEKNALKKGDGVTTGLGPTAYASQLYELNEQLPKTQKMTNAAIEENWRREFPNRTRLHLSLDAGSTSANAWRHKYNQGMLTNQGKPQQLSVRYNMDGRPVDSRDVDMLLSSLALLVLHNKYRPKESKEELLKRMGVKDVKKAIDNFYPKQDVAGTKRRKQ